MHFTSGFNSARERLILLLQQGAAQPILRRAVLAPDVHEALVDQRHAPVGQRDVVELVVVLVPRVALVAARVGAAQVNGADPTGDELHVLVEDEVDVSLLARLIVVRRPDLAKLATLFLNAFEGLNI